MDLDTLEDFYTRCIARNATTLEEKNMVLMELFAEKKATYVGHTNKSGPELAVELIKKGIKAQSIGFKAKKTIDKE